MTSQSPDELPRAPQSIPPRLIDLFLIALSGFFYIGVLVGDLTINFGDSNDQAPDPARPWDAVRIVGAVFAPSVIALWWRRRYPVHVLGVALAATLAASQAAGIFGVVALFTAASRLPQRGAVVAGIASLGCIFAGYAIVEGTPILADAMFFAIGTAVVTAVGLYAGARRAYLGRLREQALYARALASFLPAGVAELVQESPSALHLEQELEATVLFSDIRGFSTVAEHLAPREVAAVVGRHATAMAEVVLAHGGMLDKFAGDGVMAVFGAPKPMPGDEDRAIACAVAMQRRQRELNVEGPSTGHAPTEIGIGVNTGLVIAGTLGGAGRLDYTVIGDAVNVAQRLQSEAGPGEILVSAATVGRGSWPSAEAAGVRELKGRKEPVDVFRIAWEDATSLR